MKKFSYVSLIGRLLPIGERAVVKMGRNKYIIYLPTQFNLSMEGAIREGR